MLAGIDLVDVADLKSAIELATDADRYLASYWTAAELEYCDGDPHKLAGRWAAKEATLKALGLGIGPLSLRDVEVVPTEGAPLLRTHGPVQQRSHEMNVDHWVLSIAHDGRSAIAIAIGATKSEGI